MSLKNKLILNIFILGLLPVFLLTSGFYISSYLKFNNSLGQILLLVMVTILFTTLWAFFIFKWLKKTYLGNLNITTEFVTRLSQGNYIPKIVLKDGSEWKDLETALNATNEQFVKDSKKFFEHEAVVTAEKKKFEVAIFDLTDPIMVLDNSFKILSFNKAAEELTGLKKVDALGNPISTVIKIYDRVEELPPAVFVPLQPKGFEGVIFNAPEVRIVSSTNKEGYADMRVMQLREGSLINVSCIIMFHDTTREKQLESMKMDFVSMAAHELRTPLTSVKGYISVFINENKDKLTEEQMMFLRRISTSTQQLSALVENLLSVSRVERGAMSLHTQIVDWTTNVKTQVELFQIRAYEKRISIEFIPPVVKIPSVNADAVRINEVLGNLISNAINYTEPGGTIEISIELKDEEVITHVKDTGKGIPKDLLPRLFTKFFRVQGGGAEQASKGNGLGLYLSKAIVDLHHGKIWADSEGEGKGAIFSFSLPSVTDKID